MTWMASMALLGPADLRGGEIVKLCSFAHLAMLGVRHFQGLFRLHQKQITDFRPHRRRRRKGEKGRPSSRFVRRLGRHDQLVEWFKPLKRPQWMTARQWASLPATLRVRELRYHQVGERSDSTPAALPSPRRCMDRVRYPKKIAELYGIRWTVVTHFADFKTTLNNAEAQVPDRRGCARNWRCIVWSLTWST